MYSEDRTENNMLKLEDLFYKPEMLNKLGVFDSLVRGMATQAAGKIDNHYNEDVSKTSAL